MLFLETGSPAKSLSTKTVILSTCSCLRNRYAIRGFPTRYRAARFQRNEIELAKFSHSLVQMLRGFCKIQPVFSQLRKSHACRWVTHCIFFFSESDIFSRLNTNLSCNSSRGVLTDLVFVLHPDSLMTCLKSGSMSLTNSKHTVQQRKMFRV